MNIHFKKIIFSALFTVLLVPTSRGSALEPHLDIDVQMAQHRKIFSTVGGNRLYEESELIQGLAGMLAYGQQSVKLAINNLQNSGILSSIRYSEYVGIIDQLRELTDGEAMSVLNYKTAVRQLVCLLEEAYNAMPDADGKYVFKYRHAIDQYTYDFDVENWRDISALREFTKLNGGQIPQFYVFLPRAELSCRDFVEPFLGDLSFPMMPTPVGIYDPDIAVHGAPGQEDVIGILSVFLHDEFHWQNALHLVPDFPSCDHRGRADGKDSTRPRNELLKSYLTWLAKIYRDSPESVAHLFELLHESTGAALNSLKEGTNLMKILKTNIAKQMQSDYIEVFENQIERFMKCFMNLSPALNKHNVDPEGQHILVYDLCGYSGIVSRVNMRISVTPMLDGGKNDEKLTINAIDGLDNVAPYYVDAPTKSSNLQELIFEEDLVIAGINLEELTLENLCSYPYGSVYLLNLSENGRKALFYHDLNKIYRLMTGGRDLDVTLSLGALNTQYYGEALRFIEAHESSFVV